MIFVRASRQSFLQWEADPANVGKPTWMFQIDRNGKALAHIRSDALNKFLNEKRKELTDSDLSKEDNKKLYNNFVRMFKTLLMDRFPAVFANLTEDKYSAGIPSDDFYKFEQYLGSSYGPKFYGG